MKKIGFLLVVICILISGIASASVIETVSSWNGTDSIQRFGETNTATYGQTFTVGTDTRLDNFTFYLNDLVNPDNVDFKAYVMAWDGAKASGSALYQSSALSTTNNGGNDGWEAFSINTGGLNLTSGNQYVAFFSASGLFDGSFGTSLWGGLGGADSYAGGQFVFQNNGDDFSQLTSSPWTGNWQGTGADSVFSMEFSAPVPEPTTMLLFGLGLLGLAGINRKKS